MRQTRWILAKAFRFCFPFIFVNIFILVVSTFLSFALAFMNRLLLNELAIDTVGEQISVLFIVLLAIYLLVYLLGQVSSYLLAFGYNYYRFNVDALFHRIFMWKSYRTPQEQFYDPKFMETYAFVSGQTGKISSYINNLCMFFFSGVGGLIGSMIVFAVYEPVLILHTLMVGILAFWSKRYFAKKEYELDKKQVPEQRFHDYYRVVLTGKENAKELRLYHLRDSFFRKWMAVYERLRLARLQLALRKRRMYGLQGIIKLGFRAAAVGILFWGISKHRYDLGTFVMLFQLIETCTRVMDSIAQTVVSGGYKDMKYLKDYYDFVYPITNEEIRQIKKDSPSVCGQLPFGDFSELRADHISYAYPEGTHNAVEDITLSIKRGEIVSILGYNGSGKTTLSKLLCGSLSPQSGQVTLNGIAIKKGNREAVSQYFGFAPQEFPRFILPISEVVGLGCVEKMQDRSALDLAYKKMELTEWISSYKEGEQTILGKAYDDEGVDLSGGQWQRLILAAAYMGEPEILLMDEPTASIDPLKEMEMIRDFRKNLAGKTAILISHRIGFARLADRIIMLEDGRVVEQGSHEDLLRANGAYAKLFHAQKALYEEATL